MSEVVLPEDLADFLNDLKRKSKRTIEGADGRMHAYTPTNERWEALAERVLVTWWEVHTSWNKPDPYEMTLGDLFTGRWTKRARIAHRKEA